MHANKDDESGKGGAGAGRNLLPGWGRLAGWGGWVLALGVGGGWGWADGGPASPYWTVEDAAERERLPMFQVIEAARAEELTSANGFPARGLYRTWERSHGDNGGTRYSALDQINRGNVARLRQAWIYHSKDGSNNLQCNPIVVGELMIGPTAGKQVVGVKAAEGSEVWRFRPEGRPACRGLVPWAGRGGVGDRVVFCAGR